MKTSESQNIADTSSWQDNRSARRPFIDWLATKAFRILAIGCLLAAGTVGNVRAASGGPTPNGLTILGAEPSFANGVLLISGRNFGGSTFTGTATLFAPTMGELNLVLTGYNGIAAGNVQELVAVLPAAVSNFPGTFTLTVSTGNGTSKTDTLDLAIGVTGPQGVIGLTGPIGPKGDKGDTGFTGAQGLTGATGPQGQQGIVGQIGLTGPIGPQGIAGTNGLDGAQGPMGPQGEKGDIGLTGAVGPKGDKGDTGATGAQGLTGATGPQGPQGPQGVQGLTGPEGQIGPIGLTGAEGPQGAAGSDGAQGPMGPQGARGMTFLGAWTATSDYSVDDAVAFNGSTWLARQTNTNILPIEGADWTLIAAKGDTGTVGEAGPQGPQGPVGTTGATGAQGPQGVQGVVGPQGVPGDQGIAGSVGPQGPAGTSPFALNGTNTTYMAGNVGIGTDAPGGVLEVFSPGGSAEAIDESNDPDNFGITSVNKGQSFTAGETGILFKLAIYGTNDASTTGTLTVYSGSDYSGSVLASQTVSVVGNGWIDFALSPAVSVVQGQTYAFRLQTADGFTARGSSGDVYPGGSALNGGGTPLGTGRDLAFRTYLGAPTLFANDGRVGIGTRQPQHELDVTGTIRATTFVGSFSAADLTGTINAAQIANSAITSAQLAAGAVNQNKLAADSVGSNSIIDGSVRTEEIRDGAVTDAKIADVNASKLTGTIDNARIALTVSEIPGLDASKISAGTIDNARLALTAADIPDLSGSQITSGDLQAARLKVGTGHTLSGPNATIGGGSDNTANVNWATVAGGRGNAAGNGASGWYATVGGGYGNTASHNYATVPGGKDNTASGLYSFAAGNRAKAIHQGAYVWADSTPADFGSTQNDEFAVRAAGGLRLDGGAFIGDGSGLTTLNASRLTSGTIDNARIANGAITGAKIADNGVTTAKIIANAVTTAKIIDNAITDAKIANVSASKLTGTIDNARISLTAAQIPNLNASKITTGTFGTAQIANDAITGAKIADGTITGTDLAPSSVGSNRIIDGAVNTVDIKDSAVTDVKIASVSAGKITSGTLNSSRIPDLPTSKITSGTFGTDRITAGAVTDAKIQSMDATKLTGSIKVYNDGRMSFNAASTDNVSYNFQGIPGTYSVINVAASDGRNLFGVYDNGNAWVIDDISADAFITNSDRRLKHSIAELDEALPSVRQLRPVTYRLNKDGEEGPLNIGFIAQEVQSLFPEAVSTNGAYLAVNYGNFGPIAIKAIQEQQTQLDEKEARIKSLEERLTALEALMQQVTKTAQ